MHIVPSSTTVAKIGDPQCFVLFEYHIRFNDVTEDKLSEDQHIYEALDYGRRRNHQFILLYHMLMPIYFLIRTLIIH